MFDKKASVIITSYNEGLNLDQILSDLSLQDLDQKFFEILLLEAGNYPETRARNQLGQLCHLLRFFHVPGLSRTASLNRLINEARGALIVRLDARSHIKPDYLDQILNLSLKTGAANVGGVQVPIGRTKEQNLIAYVMSHPASFGGAKSRNKNYTGYADSVYLGAFNRSLINFDTWFDEIHPKISEDSDLNFRIRTSGGQVFLDSAISVEHFPRESLKSFFKLCFNYGVGRGLFILKHKQFSAIRQTIPPLALVSMFFLLISSIFYRESLHIFFWLTALYLFFLASVSFSLKFGLASNFKILIAIAGCHLCWATGVLYSPRVYLSDIRRQL